MGGMMKNTESEIKKRNTINEKKDKKEIEKKSIMKQIQEESKNKLLPTLQEKTKEATEYIVNLLNKKGEEKVNNIQIMSIIAQRSMVDIANAGNITFTPQEILISFNLYLEMINKINEIKKFPPTVESFAIFMGISRNTYNNWLVDPDKKSVMDYIHSYLLGMLATSALTGEIREISSMYLQKTMGKVEQQQPITVKHEVAVNEDDIRKQIDALKQNNIIEAEYEENE